ncbi:MAG: hypothetical protein C0605_12510 [Hyphomicrobiales bacterium]|nr:MAG: hypothetical protein C0605_12510 [Hyphomicrobiales bacterium]
MNSQKLLAGTGIATCLLAGAYPATPAFCEIIVLDTIVVSTSRSQEQLRETPNAVSLVSKKEVEEVNFLDSRKELLSRIPGNSMVRNLRIPIGGKNYTINLVDGLAVRGLGRGTNTFVDESNPFDIERVEVIKGPASSLYGSNAVGGVINIISRKPPKVLQARTWAEFGSWGRKRAGATATGPITGNLGFFFDANIAKSDGWQDRTSIDRKRVSGKLVWDYGEGSSLTLRAEHLELFNENPGTLTKAQYDADWRQAGILDAYVDQKLSSFSAILDHNFSDKTSFKVSWGLRKTEEKGPPSWSARGQFGVENDLTNNVVPQLQHKFDFLNSQIVFGVDFIHDDINEDTLTGRTESSPIDDTYDILGIQKSPFAQLVFWPTSWMKVSAGARYDYRSMSMKGVQDLTGAATPISHKRVFRNLSKNAGVTFNINPDASLWFGYGEGFVVPSDTALWIGGRYNPDPNLKAERAQNFAVGVRGAALGGKFGYDVSLYNTTVKDMVLNNATDYLNAGKVRLRGLEASLTYQPLSWLGFGAAYTLAQNKLLTYFSGSTDHSGNILSASPLHHVNARMILTPGFLEGFRTELEWDHVSKYHTANSNDDPLGKYQRPSLFHLRASYEQKNFKIMGSIRNLTNVKHADRVTYDSRGGRSYTSGEPRTFVLRAALKL